MSTVLIPFSVAGSTQRNNAKGRVRQNLNRMITRDASPTHVFDENQRSTPRAHDNWQCASPENVTIYELILPFPRAESGIKMHVEPSDEHGNHRAHLVHCQCAADAVSRAIVERHPCSLVEPELLTSRLGERGPFSRPALRPERMWIWVKVPRVAVHCHMHEQVSLCYYPDSGEHVRDQVGICTVVPTGITWPATTKEPP
jgi:hypothetical protein